MDWSPHHLQRTPEDGQTLVDLVVLELEEIRTAGRDHIGDALVQLLSRQGVVDQRLELSPPTKKTSPDALTVLRRVCMKAGVSPTVLTETFEGDLDLACAREMQSARQQGLHQLVVNLGRKARKLGVRHPRIASNLMRSERLLRHQNVLDTVEKLLAGNRSAREKAEQLMLEAITEDPEFTQCRQLLLARLRERMGRKRKDPFLEELLEERVALELNRRRLELLEQRLQATGSPSNGVTDQAERSDG